jgi:hypothetical protein
MKKITLQILTTLSFIVAIGQNAFAQTFTINASAPWVGYMNVFDMSNNYQWGSFWGVPALKTIVNTGANSVTFQPNFNTYADAIASGNPGDIAYWTNGAGSGNKIMDALTFIEPAGVGGQTVTFTGFVTSKTLNPGYIAKAFIKILDPNIGYAQTAYTDVVIGGTGTSFTVSMAIPAMPANLITQYGVSIRGVNANPANEASLGSLVLSPVIALSANLENFTANVKKQQVDLNWKTSNEINVQGFDVEKSVDGKTFNKINTVKALNQSAATYASTDLLLSGAAYYRLKMIDNDGKNTYSSVVKAIALSISTVKVYPNPAVNTLRLYVQDLNSTNEFTIFNSFGQPVLSSKLNHLSNDINISQLSIGSYFLQFNNGEVVKFNKQ